MKKKNKEKKVLEPQYYTSRINTSTYNYKVYYMSVPEKIINVLIAFVIGACIGYLFYGGIGKDEYGQATTVTYCLNVIIPVIVGVIAVKLYIPVRIQSIIKKQKNQLNKQFRDMLEALSTSLGAGKNVIDSFRSVYDDMKMQYEDGAYIISELELLLSGMDNNIDIEDLLLDFGERSGNEDIESFAKVFQICYRKGGNIKDTVRSTYETFGTDTIFSGFVSVLQKMISGKFEAIRDDLYLSTYAMEMFSYSTIDNEGRYNILKEQGYDMSTLDKNYEDTYKTVDEKWTSELYKDYYNKTLTNKKFCKENNAAYGCELEYILYGHENNDDNIKAAYGQIYEIRYVLNLISAFENFWNRGSITGNLFNDVSEVLSAATSGVIPFVAIKAVLIALITVFETGNDMNRLEAGFSVELYKTDAKMWQVSLDFDESNGDSIDGLSAFVKSFSDKFKNGIHNSCENGLRYSDYLCIFIVCGMQSDIGESMTLRCADVVQANMRKITKDDGYKLENSKTYFELDSKLKVDPLLITLPLYSDYTDLYDSSSTDWCTYNIKTIRGY